MNWRQETQVNVEPLYRRALAIRERASGPRHPEVAVLLNNLAEHLRREGRVREAEPLYRRALDIQEMRVGSHPDYATTLNNWAEFLAGRGRKNEAERSYRMAWRIAQLALGSNHLLVATIQENLARHLQSIQKARSRLTLLQQALEIRTEKQGAQHPDALKTFAALDRLQGGRTPPSRSVALSALRQSVHDSKASARAGQRHLAPLANGLQKRGDALWKFLNRVSFKQSSGNTKRD